jgi:hypothetical protein
MPEKKGQRKKKSCGSKKKYRPTYTKNENTCELPIIDTKDEQKVHDMFKGHTFNKNSDGYIIPMMNLTSSIDLPRKIDPAIFPTGDKIIKINFSE